MRHEIEFYADLLLSLSRPSRTRLSDKYVFEKKIKKTEIVHYNISSQQDKN